jgi:hypothetical protein
MLKENSIKPRKSNLNQSFSFGEGFLTQLMTSAEHSGRVPARATRAGEGEEKVEQGCDAIGRRGG